MFAKEIITLRAGNLTLLDNTELCINSGSVCGLVGCNGSGKTTLLNYIANKYNSVYIKQILENTTKSIEESVISSNEKLCELMKKLDEAYDLGDDDKITDAEKNLYDEYDVDKERAMVRRLLRGLGFTNFSTPINSLSGGQQMKINLARALYMMADKLIMKTHILLLDEPTNHLDIDNVIFLTKYLRDEFRSSDIRCREHAREFKGTLIIASHDRYILDDICTDIINICNQKLVYYKGNYEKFSYEFQKQILDNNKSYDKIQKRIKEMRKKNTDKLSVDKFIVENKHIKKIEIQPVRLRFYAETNFKLMDKAPCIMHLDSIKFSFGDRLIFDNLNLIINNPMARIAIVGPNGSKKSTLLNIISGKIKPECGSLFILNKIKLSHFDQHSADHLDSESAIACIKKINPIIELFDAHKYLGDLGLKGSYHNISLGGLSGGQKSRVALAMIMVGCPDILLLDEVTNHLDMETCTALIDAINHFNGPVVIVSHNLDFIVSTNCEVYELCDYHLEKTTIDAYQQKVWRKIEE